MQHKTTRRPDAEAFWNINVDIRDQTVDCPDFLQYCYDNEKDRHIISTPDNQYNNLSWEEVRHYARENRPDMFQRIPSELRKYRQFCHTLVGRYGSVLDFVLQERLQWTDIKASAGDFAHPNNYKILYNDWPYGIDKRITHLVIWTKFEMPEDTATGALTPEMQANVEMFVKQTFHETCGEHNVCWFRNWVSLKSIHAVEHFHVMLFDADQDFLDRLTNRDRPLAVSLGYIDK